MGRKTPKLTDEDLKLWRAYTRQVRPLRERRNEDDVPLYRCMPDKGKKDREKGAGMAAATTKRPMRTPRPCGHSAAGEHPPSSRSRQDFPAAPPRGSIAGLDRRNTERLRRGKLPIDGRIDLHGMTQAQAHAALHRFVQASALSGRRCLLVITGKGLRHGASDDMYAPEPGILRRMVPRWLSEPGIAGHVLAVESAARHHGGSGAYYILLRRRRASGPGS